MAKKKKTSVKRTSNDVRGYATTNATPSLTSADVIASSIVKADRPIQNGQVKKCTTSTAVTATTATLPIDSIRITTDIQQIMEDLLQALHSYHEETKDDTAMALPPLTSLRKNTEIGGGGNDIDVTKYRRRLSVIYDTLTGLGFQFDHIREAVSAFSTNITLTLALDWLCYYIPTSELPPRFTEGLIRDSERAKKNENTGVTFIRAVSKDISPSAEIHFSAPPLEKKSLALLERHDIDTTKPNEDEKWRSEHKAWLIEQYEYDDSIDDQEEEEIPSTKHDGIRNDDNNIVATNSQQTPTISNSSCLVTGASNIEINEVTEVSIKAPTLLETERSEQAWESTNLQLVSPSDSEIQLQALKSELIAIEADLGNDANNYLRSKQEVKELKSKASKLRKQVASLEEKTRRQETAKQSILNKSSDNNDEHEYSNETVGFFSIFDDDAGSNLHQTSVSLLPTASTTPPAGIEIPDDSIPSTWTGKTPKMYLEEICRKEKYPKPIFTRMLSNGCRLRLTHKAGKITYDEAARFTSFTNAQHYLSTKALYKIYPELPLYRMFPPFYRDLWMSWLDMEKQEMIDHSTWCADQRREKIEELVQSTLQVHKGFSGNKELPVSSNDKMNPQDSSYQISKLRKSSADCIQNSPTSLGTALQQQFLRRNESSSYISMLSDRRNLPIYGYRQQILDTIQKNPVTILWAETGSGKTTQCGSYILEKALSDGKGDQVSILCTQPRRVAAISVAERVSEEWGEKSVGKLVGYQIRMEAKRSSETRLLFCTTGVILRRLIEDPDLKGISHVVVDEVHERQWQIDVLLVSLRALINGSRPDLKVVLMSATLDAKLFEKFFVGAPLVNVPGRTFPVVSFYLEDLIEHTNHLIEEGSRCSRRDCYNTTMSVEVRRRGGEKWREIVDCSRSEDISDDFSGYSPTTKVSMRRVDETVINYDLIEDVLDALLLQNSSVFAPPLARGGNSEEQLSNKLIPILGSVLIFLPGLEEIRTLLERLSGSRKFGNIERFKIVPLHSTLSSSEQRRAFIPSAPGCIKIIISTNVAETSVTIPDVVYVIDSGRVREIKRDNKTNSRKLVATWCSKASVKQRSGRAGRVQPGVCLKLYSSCTENRVMKNATEPELQRIPLDEVCLCILAGGFGKSCSDFLSQTPQPPSDDAVRSALNGLEDIGAIESNNSSSSVTPMNRSETLTSLGRHLAKLPVDARVGKMLIFGTLFRCTDAILTIAASLSVSKSPFLSALGDRQEIKSVRAQFSHPFSDFLTYVNVWNGYRDAESRGLGKSFCREKFLNYSAMREIQDARRHYLELLKGLGFLNLASLADESGKRTFDEKFTSSRYNKNSNLEYLVHGVVYASLFPNVAHLDRTGASVDATVTHKTELLFIQSSVNSKLHNSVLPSSWITYYEKFGTERRVSISTTAFISPFCLMLFGSKLQVLHAERRICIDGWIEITAPAKTGVIFQEIQSRLTDFLSSIFNKSCEFSDLTALVERIEKVIDLVVTLLSKGQG